jgi:predicted nuclease of predicted toxin-antitoxin system
MKLLFDENLSPQLVPLLNDLFPDSIHVRDVGLKAADDPVVWKYAQDTAMTNWINKHVARGRPK